MMEPIVAPPPTATDSSIVLEDLEFKEAEDVDAGGTTDARPLPTGDSDAPEKPQEPENRFLKCTKKAFRAIGNVLSFRFPIQQPPICFYRSHDHTRTGKRDRPSGDFALENELSADALEVKVNFREELFERYREVIEERLEAKAMNNPKRVDELQLDEFPGWSRAVFLRLRSLFHIFDRGGDGLVDFSEFEGTLDEYGDETPEEERKFHFQAADLESIGSIDFEQFLKMMYSLTMKGTGGSGGTATDTHRVFFSSSEGRLKKKEVTTDSGHSSGTSDTDGSEEMILTTLGNSLRQIDRNMSRIKSLDVVQQLQAGLF